MEDSYTVHRRRKAAARKREKTPEPRRRDREDVAATDEEDDARARMERMVRETERLEELEETARQRAGVEKSGERAAEAGAEKPPRALKRAVSPEVRRGDEGGRAEDEAEAEATVEVPTMGVRSDGPSADVEGARGLARKARDVGPEVAGDRPKERGAEVARKARDVGPEVAGDRPKERGAEVARKARDVGPEVAGDRPKERGAEVARRPRKAAIEGPTSAGGTSGTVERRPEVPAFSPEAALSTGRSVERAVSPEVGKLGKRRSDGAGDEPGRDVGGSAGARKTPSRISDEEDEEEAGTLDRNRREAAAARESSSTRDGEAGPARFAGGGESEGVEKPGRGRDPEEDERRSRDPEASERSSRAVDDSRRIGKREVTSPSKLRKPESRAAASTTRRSGEDRIVERTGYTTDSSEIEETARRAPRRRKSPEEGKARGSRKTPSRSRVATDTDGEADELRTARRTQKRSTSRRGRSSETDEERREATRRAPARQAERSRSTEKRSSGRPKDPSDAEEDRRAATRKSGAFPVAFPVDPPRARAPSLARSASDARKQIIPLSDGSLIEDFEKAQREYLRKERGILDRDPPDHRVDPTPEAALRRRKFSIVPTEVEAEDVAVGLVRPERRPWFGWLPLFGERAKKAKPDAEAETKPEAIAGDPAEKIDGERWENSRRASREETPARKSVSFVEFFRTLGDLAAELRAFVEQNPRETREIRLLRNRCAVELLLAVIYCGLGAFVFRFSEGAFETFYKCGVKRVKRDFLDSLWNFSHNMREEDWKSMARRKLMEFEEQLHAAHEAGVHSYSGQKNWSFLNAAVYCLTVITTIGYGHISPSTTTGRAITIVYAIFGIPMFLIILADFGKLFTRGIKFLWAFVRRVYYTGSCRRVRRTGPVQEVMKGVQLVYDLATFRRPSQMNPEEIQEMHKQQSHTQTVLNLDGSAPSATVPPDTPGTPAMSTFAIDDEFNLPISVAIFILLVYIFVGATVYNFWEEWGFFESFYFVFISMSTIGFGDYVPKHPIYMMLSIVYLVFGLALTSMCINVVQVMLSDSFKQASQKIGATIGFEIAEDDGSIEPAQDPVELADDHTTIKESESKEQVAPKAKQEDVEL